MNRDTMYKILSLQESAWKDPTFQALVSEHTLSNKQFLDVVTSLSSEEQDTIFHYVGLLIEIQNKLLEYSFINTT